MFGRERFSRFPVLPGFRQRVLFLVLIPKAKTLGPPAGAGRTSQERRDGDDTPSLVLLPFIIKVSLDVRSPGKGTLKYLLLVRGMTFKGCPHQREPSIRKQQLEQSGLAMSCPSTSRSSSVPSIHNRTER